jgi:hypothetical protein
MNRDITGDFLGKNPVKVYGVCHVQYIIIGKGKKQEAETVYTFDENIDKTKG